MIRVIAAVILGGLIGGIGVSLAVRACESEPRVTLDGDRAIAELQVELVNSTSKLRHYTVTVAEAPDTTLRATAVRYPLMPGARATVPLVVDAPISSFIDGQRTFYLRVDDDAGSQRIIAATISSR